MKLLITIVIPLSDNICYTRNNSQFKHDASIPEMRLIVRQLVSKLPPRSPLFRYQLFRELIYLRVANPPRNRDRPCLPKSDAWYLSDGARWRGGREKEKGKKKRSVVEELRRVSKGTSERKHYKAAIEGCASNIVRCNPSLWDPGQTVFISFVYRGLHVRVSTMKHRTDVNVSRNRKPEHATLQVCARAWLRGGGAAVQNAKLSRMCSRPCLGSPPPIEK